VVTTSWCRCPTPGGTFTVRDELLQLVTLLRYGPTCTDATSDGTRPNHDPVISKPDMPRVGTIRGSTAVTIGWPTTLRITPGNDVWPLASATTEASMDCAPKEEVFRLH